MNRGCIERSTQRFTETWTVGRPIKNMKNIMRNKSVGVKINNSKWEHVTRNSV